MVLQNFFEDPLLTLFWLLGIVIAVSVHEFAHAKVADYLGDPTPRAMGRVTLNPLAHLDLFGSLVFLIFGFGWGKPVLFDPFNLKNPRRDSALISLAGPVSNIALAFFTAVIFKILSLFLIFTLDLLYLNFLIFSFIQINLILAFFNLVPIYPLDGFKIVEGFLPEEKAREWSELRHYGPIFLLLFILPFGNQSLAEKTIGPLIKISMNILSLIF